MYLPQLPGALDHVGGGGGGGGASTAGSEMPGLALPAELPDELLFELLLLLFELLEPLELPLRLLLPGTIVFDLGTDRVRRPASPAGAAAPDVDVVRPGIRMPTGTRTVPPGWLRV